MTMTYDEFDETVAAFERINRKRRTFWPTSSDMEYMERNPDRFVLYLTYLDTTNEKPINAEEEYSRKNIKQFIYEHLNLVDQRTTINNRQLLIIIKHQ